MRDPEQAEGDEPAEEEAQESPPDDAQDLAPGDRPERRYQIFISSPFSLADERRAAVEAIIEQGHIPIALERSSADHETDLKVIERAIKDSQIYLLILGHRYGEIVKPESLEH